VKSSRNSRRKARVERQMAALKRKRVKPFEVGQEMMLPEYEGIKYVITSFPARTSVVLEAVNPKADDGNPSLIKTSIWELKLNWGLNNEKSKESN